MKLINKVKSYFKSLLPQRVLIVDVLMEKKLLEDSIRADQQELANLRKNASVKGTDELITRIMTKSEKLIDYKLLIQKANLKKMKGKKSNFYYIYGLSNMTSFAKSLQASLKNVKDGGKEKLISLITDLKDKVNEKIKETESLLTQFNESTTIVIPKKYQALLSPVVV